VLKYENSRKNQPDYFSPREYRTTVDMADGQPLPPFYEGTPWRVVMRVGGHTIWCRSVLSLASLVTRDAAGRAFNPAAQQQTKDQ
jgi:hypothetical protein